MQIKSPPSRGGLGGAYVSVFKPHMVIWCCRFVDTGTDTPMEYTAG